MSQSIEEYLSQLKELMKECDTAVVRDALADAEEHLRSAMEGQEPPALDAIIEDYGSPEETAAAYAILEERIKPGFLPVSRLQDKPWLAGVFGVFIDSRAWGAVLFSLISLITGTIYFSWVVTGFSLSVSMIIMIFGIPLAALIFLSFRGLGLFEGRIVEALLGVRMPRRPIFTRKDVTLMEKMKAVFCSRHTWFSMLYLLLQFPISITNFCMTISLFATGLSLIAVPILKYAFHIPMFVWNGLPHTFADWSMPLFVLGGILVLTINMHVAKGIGWLHGKLARALLVAK